MSGYLLSVIGIVLIAAVLTAVCPNGKTAATVKAITRLACVLAIVAPILRFFKTGAWENLQNNSSDFTQIGIPTDVGFIEYYSQLRIAENERALECELLEKYEILATVSFLWSFEEEKNGIYNFEQIRIEKINVKTAQAVEQEKVREIQAKMQKEYGCEVWIE